MLPLITGFVGVLVGTATDIDHREVPDWVNYSLIAAGLGFGAIGALEQFSFWPLLESAAGLAAGFLLGALMYYTGQWGGGDAKLIMGVGALAGLPLSLAGWSPAPFFALFLLWSVLVGAAYGLLWMLVLFIKHRRKVVPALRERLHSARMVKVRIAVLVLAVLLAAIGFFFPTPLTILVLAFAAIVYLTFYLSLAVKAVEKTCFVQERAVSDLVEGDWVVGAVEHDGEVLVEDRSTGVSREEISLLEERGVGSVTIKEGIPFVPSFLVAYVVAWAWAWLELPLLFWL